MRLLFAHDHRFVRGPGSEVFTQGSFPAAVWERYLAHFNALRVVARDQGVLGDQNLARSDVAGVSYALVKPPSLLERLGLRKGSLHAAIVREVAAADAVIARLPSDIGLLAVREAKRQRRPVLIEVVGCAFDGYGNHGSRIAGLYAPLALWRMKRAAAHADFAIYVTERWLQSRYPAIRGRADHASDVILDPIALQVLQRREQRLARLAEGAHPVFGTVASLRTASKGLQTMLTALSELKKSGATPPEWRVLGPGDPEPWRQMAMSLGVEDHVHFDGVRPSGAPVLDWLEGIDVHCQPSFQEGLPRATIEAMSRGCACLGSTAGGLPELLPENRTHPPGDVAALKALVRHYQSSAEDIAEASRRDAARARDYLGERIESRRRKLFAEFAKAATERKERLASHGHV